MHLRFIEKALDIYNYIQLYDIFVHNGLSSLKKTHKRNEEFYRLVYIPNEKEKMKKIIKKMRRVGYPAPNNLISSRGRSLLFAGSAVLPF